MRYLEAQVRPGAVSTVSAAASDASFLTDERVGDRSGPVTAGAASKTLSPTDLAIAALNAFKGSMSKTAFPFAAQLADLIRAPSVASNIANTPFLSLIFEEKITVDALNFSNLFSDVTKLNTVLEMIRDAMQSAGRYCGKSIENRYRKTKKLIGLITNKDPKIVLKNILNNPFLKEVFMENKTLSIERTGKGTCSLNRRNLLSNPMALEEYLTKAST